MLPKATSLCPISSWRIDGEKPITVKHEDYSTKGHTEAYNLFGHRLDDNLMFEEKVCLFES